MQAKYIANGLMILRARGSNGTANASSGEGGATRGAYALIALHGYDDMCVCVSNFMIDELFALGIQASMRACGRPHMELGRNSLQDITAHQTAADVATTQCKPTKNIFDFWRAPEI